MFKIVKENKEDFKELVKNKLISWSKNKDLKAIVFNCSFTAYYIERKDVNSNEDLIESFFEKYISRMEITTKNPKFVEENDRISVKFKFSANNGEDYSATGQISLIKEGAKNENN